MVADPRIPAPLRDEEWLRHHYCDLGWTQQRIADKAGCNRLTVLRAMQRHRIEGRSCQFRPGDGIVHPELHNMKMLRAMYADQGMSTREIAAKIGVDSGGVWRALKRLGIEVRPQVEAVHRGPRVPRLADREWLRKHYVELEMSLSDIGQMLGVSRATVRGWTKSHGISLRPPVVDKEQRKASARRGPNHPNYGKPPSPMCSRGKGGLRLDLGHFVRSSWEANFARVLRRLGLRYEYEPRTFDLDDRTYTPDFHLVDAGVYVEVSGYVSDEKTAKLEAMKAKFPDTTVLHVTKDLYEAFVRPFRNDADLELDRLVVRRAA